MKKFNISKRIFKCDSLILSILHISICRSMFLFMRFKIYDSDILLYYIFYYNFNYMKESHIFEKEFHAEHY